MSRPFRVVPALVLLTLAACPPSSTSSDTAADEQAIHTIVEGWNGAIASHNDSLIAAGYAVDAVMMPPAMPRAMGRENIRNSFAQIWPLKATLSFTSGAVKVSGDLAAEEGTYIWTMPGPHGDINDHGNYITIWRRTTTSWEAIENIWNSSVPAPTTGAK